MSENIVFVLNKDTAPLDPTSPAKARKLLDKQKAVIHKQIPFTIRLKEQKVANTQDYRLKIDYGSLYTGLAILRGSDVIWLGQLHHRSNIKMRLQDRSARRSNRRSRKTRYRKARFDNRTRKAGWVPPSLQSRVDHIESFTKKYLKLIPIKSISYELVKFDTQLMNNPNIDSVQYQQGTLAGYEVREYLLEKFNRTCMYCHVQDVPLEIEHIHPKSRGGSDNISNLGIACRDCNAFSKKNLMLDEWIEELEKSKSKKNQLMIKNIRSLSTARTRTLRDVAVVNATRFKVLEVLRSVVPDVETSTGARTKMNRIARNLPKEHHFDAVCVGASTPVKLNFVADSVTHIKAMGRGHRQMITPDKYGFARGHRSRDKMKYGIQTGDYAKASIPKGKYKGDHVGRIAAVKANGTIHLQNSSGKTLSLNNHKYFTVIQKSDGYRYHVDPL